MKISKVCSLFCFFISMLFCTSQAYAMGANSVQLINPSGGTSGTDGIRVYIGSNSQVQVVGWSELTGAPGVYPQMYSGCGSSGCTGFATPNSGNMFNSVILRLEPIGGGPARVIYSNSDTAIGGIGGTNFVQTSQTAITGTGTPIDPFTVITVLNPPAPDTGITVILTDTYVYPNPFFSRKIDLTGLPAAEQAKLYWYIDTYLAGGDSGYATSQTSAGNMTGIPDFIGVTKPGVLQGIQNSSGMPLWDHYYSNPSYSLPTSTYIPSATGDLPDTIGAGYGDNAIAVQWNVPPGQTSFTVATGQTYGGSALVSEAYVPTTIFTGQTSSLQFTFQNFDDVTALAGLGSSYPLPTGVVLAAVPALSNGCSGATVSMTGGIIAISNVSLPVAINNTTPSTCTVSLNVTSSVAGVYTGILTPTSAGLTVAQSGSDTLTVQANGGGGGTSVPVPLFAPWALLVLMCSLGIIGIRRSSR